MSPHYCWLPAGHISPARWSQLDLSGLELLSSLGILLPYQQHARPSATTTPKQTGRNKTLNDWQASCVTAGSSLSSGAGLFLSHGDSDSELQNLSTQLARFPLAVCYHANLVLQTPHGLCGVPPANPHFAAITFSPEPGWTSTWRKTQHKLSSERNPTLVNLIKFKSSGGESWQICHWNQETLVATSCPHAIPVLTLSPSKST